MGPDWGPDWAPVWPNGSLEGPAAAEGRGRDLGTLESLTYSLPAMLLVALVLLVVIVVTAFGNLLVCLALIRYRCLRTVSNILIGNLAVSDFLLAVTVLPLSSTNECLGRWVFGRALCNVWLVADVLYCTASIWNLAIIALDRYTATLYPLWYRERRSAAQAGLYIVLIWVVAAGAGVPPLLGWNDLTQNYIVDNVTAVEQCVLFQTPSYVLYSAGVSFYIPFALTFFLYVRIFVVLRRRLQKMRGGAGASKHVPQRGATNRLMGHGEGEAARVEVKHVLPTAAETPTIYQPGLTAVEPSQVHAAVDSNSTVMEKIGATAVLDGTTMAVPEEDGKMEEEESSSKSALISDSDLVSSDDEDEETHDLTELTTPNELSPDATRSPETRPSSMNLRPPGKTRTLRKRLSSLSLRIKRKTSAEGAETKNNCSVVVSSREGKQCAQNGTANTALVSEVTVLENANAEVTAKLDKELEFIQKPNFTRQSSTRIITNGPPPSKRTGSSRSAARGGGSRRASSRTGSRVDRVASAKRCSSRRSERREMRATMRMAAIIGVFCGMWVGFFTVYVIGGWCPQCSVPRWLEAFFFWLGYANSTVNPILYTIFNDDFRKAFQKLLGCYKQKGRGRSFRRR